MFDQRKEIKTEKLVQKTWLRKNPEFLMASLEINTEVGLSSENTYL